MAGSQRRNAQHMYVVFDSLTRSFPRSLEQRSHIHVKATIGISGSYHFGPTVMTVLSHLRYHDTRLATFLFSEFFAQFRCPNEIGILFSL